MLWCNSLWDEQGYHTLLTRIERGNDSLQQFVTLLTHRIQSEQDNHKRLAKLAHLAQPNEEAQLAIAINHLQQEHKHQANTHHDAALLFQTILTRLNTYILTRNSHFKLVTISFPFLQLLNSL